MRLALGLLWRRILGDESETIKFFCQRSRISLPQTFKVVLCILVNEIIFSIMTSEDDKIGYATLFLEL